MNLFAATLRIGRRAMEFFSSLGNKRFRPYRLPDSSERRAPEIVPEMEPPAAATVVEEFSEFPPVHAAKDLLDKQLGATLPELLDTVDDTFDNLTRRAHGGSFTHADLRAGLKNLGPFVPIRRRLLEFLDQTSEDRTDEVVVPVGNGLKFPSLMFVALNFGVFSNDKRMWPDFAYANRIKSLPLYVEQRGGIVYECGAAFRDGSKLLWCGYYVVVDPTTGQIGVCREWRNEQVSVGAGQYGRRVYEIPDIYTIDPSSDRAKYSAEQYRLRLLGATFAEVLQIWRDRQNRWCVSVRRDRRRVTFGIEKSDTARFFRDRDRSVLTPSGQRKKIIHYVNGHDRTLATGRTVRVKEHIRGERRFDWKGYAVAVTAPEFHKFSATNIDVSGDWEENLGKTGIPMNRAGEMLASLEDEQAAVHPVEFYIEPIHHENS